MLLALVTWLAGGIDSVAQNNGDAKAKLTLPGEHDLATLVDYVSQRLEVKILYDNKLANKKINIRAPGDVPIDSLPGVLQSALRMNDLALVDTNVPGWKQIVEVTRMPQASTENDAMTAFEKSGGETAVTQVFVLEHADVAQLEPTIRPFLSQGTGNTANVLAVKDQRMLIVTDFASNILRLEKLIKLIDQPGEVVSTRFIPAKSVDAETLALKLQELLTARQKASGKKAETGPGVEVSFDVRTNQVIVIGNSRQVQQVEQYLQTLDVSVDLRSEFYQLRRVNAERVERLIKGMLEVREAKIPFRSTVDVDQNVLIATTSDDIHKEIQRLIDRIDVSSQGTEAERNSPVRFYKLKHAKAEDLIRTIQELEGSEVQAPLAEANADRENRGRFEIQPDRTPNGVTRPNTQLPDEVMNRSGQLPQGVTDAAAAAASELASTIRIPEEQEEATQGNQQLTLAEAIGRARVTADVPANMLIVVATPDVHEVYSMLIERLDQARPQVLIEAKLVVLDTSDDFTLGVEVSGGDRTGTKKLFAFSSYGFSEVNRTNGALSILPGLGFNGTLVNPQVADVVLRAVTNHRRAKVMSSPRVLVNDHATGYLTSVTEIPFNSFNTFNTVSSTSFAGYAEAGTTVTVTPHISEGDHLQLEYTITMNAFQAAAGTGGGPPPRQTDEIESVVTIPDGYTIIVGGLTRSNHSVTVDSIPFLEQVPWIRNLISKTSQTMSGTSLFVFLRPVILRDDKFRELKYLSDRDVKGANVAGTYPTSEPLLVK
jgi:general secretion pathway protein D